MTEPSGALTPGTAAPELRRFIADWLAPETAQEEAMWRGRLAPVLREVGIDVERLAWALAAANGFPGFSPWATERAAAEAIAAEYARLSVAAAEPPAAETEG